MENKPAHILTTNILSLPKSYFDRVVEPSRNEAAQKISIIEKTYRIAGKNICVRFYGQQAVDILSLAIAGHPEATGPADMTIHAWDSSSLQKELVAPWDEPDFDLALRPTDDSFLGAYLSGEESLNFFDSATNTGYFWTHDIGRLPDWVLGAPFRTILHWFFNQYGLHLIHGAVVGHEGKSVLLSAKSGSGKSTTSIAALLSGMDYLADDYIILEIQETVRAHSLYHSAKVTASALHFFPELTQHIFNDNFSDKEKGVLFIDQVFPTQVREQADLHAIFIPALAESTQIIPTNKMSAMLAIAPTTLLQLPITTADKTAVFKRIIDTLPCYKLELGPDVRAVPETIKAFLRDATI